MGNTYGTLALVFGLIGCCCCCLSPLAIIFGAVGMAKDDETTLAIIGLILGVIGCICLVVWIVYLGMAFTYA
jgi:hypothetical protein